MEGLNSKYYYKAFDLVIESEIEMNELLPADDVSNIDVKVLFGYSKGQSCYKEKNYFYDEKNRRFKFDVEEAGCYIIDHGRLIRIEPYEPIDITAIKQYLLGVAFGALLGQRNIAALHSSSLALEDSAIIICGECGAGKSTTSCNLLNNGYKLISDDISVVKTHNNIPYVYPSYPQQKLCSDAAYKMGYDIKQLLLIDEERDKYAIKVEEKFENRPVKLTCFYELAVADCKEVKVSQIFGKDKLLKIIDNIYYNFTLKDINLNQELLSSLLNIVTNVPFYHIDRPRGMDSANYIEEIITKNMQSKNLNKGEKNDQ